MRIPVRLTEVKEPRLQGRIGHILMNDPATNMATSFIVDVGEEFHCQLGPWEFEILDRDDPEYPS